MKWDEFIYIHNRDLIVKKQLCEGRFHNLLWTLGLITIVVGLLALSESVFFLEFLVFDLAILWGLALMFFASVNVRKSIDIKK